MSTGRPRRVPLRALDVTRMDEIEGQSAAATLRVDELSASEKAARTPSTLIGGRNENAR